MNKTDSMPVIGISASYSPDSREYHLRKNYVDAVLRSGGFPLLLPFTEERGLAAAQLSLLDGLLLSGGVDVNPARYGEEVLPKCGSICDERDAHELLLLEQALPLQMPVLAICRGIQVLNVALGGTLIQDIETQRGLARENHFQGPPYTRGIHPVRFTAEPFLSIYGDTALVNSMHHQCVRDLAPGLLPAGFSEDGILEAVVSRDNPAVVGVQFHPEYLAEGEETSRKLFGYFVSCSQSYRREHHHFQ